MFPFRSHYFLNSPTTQKVTVTFYNPYLGITGHTITSCFGFFCTETEVLSAQGMFCCDRHEGHLVGLKQWRLRCPQLSQMFFVALVEIKGDKSTASETPAWGPTIFKLLLSVLNEVRCAQLLLPVECCHLWTQTGISDKFQEPVAKQSEFDWKGYPVSCTLASQTIILR